jgi:hypothetical protein
MPSNLERYRKDLDALVAKGEELEGIMEIECYPARLEKTLKDSGPKEKRAREALKNIPAFKTQYQQWYSQAKALIKQLLPDRLSDFVAHYERPSPRKTVDYETYKILDYLQGLTVTKPHAFPAEEVVGPKAAIPQFEQQLAILKSAVTRFESSLFEIRQMVLADLLDSELEAAEVLAKNKFGRAAGALSGVALEKHLAQVCDNHSVKLGKRDPTISELNDALKAAGIVDIPQWRFVQHLADIRNLCDHKKATEPTPEQVDDLIAGTKKITKTLF